MNNTHRITAERLAAQSSASSSSRLRFLVDRTVSPGGREVARMALESDGYFPFGAQS